MKYKHFTEIPVWQKAHALTLKIYQITKKYPQEEKYRLVDQTCRASSSIGSNIAEGSEKFSKKDKRNYLVTAKSSAIELENHLLLARDLEYITEEEFKILQLEIYSISAQLGGWIKVL